MSDSSKLLKMQRELRKLEKEELTLNGSVSTLLDSLKSDLGDHSIPDDEVAQAVKEKVKQLTIKRNKAKDQLAQKMELIEEMADILED